MGWLKLDETFFLHPKAVAAGRDGRDLYLAALCWSSQQMTDGVIPATTLPLIAALAGVVDFDHAASRLVEVGLWHNDVDGWVVHDYLSHQQSREKRQEWLAKERERKQHSRDMRRDERAQRVPTASARIPRGIPRDVRSREVEVEVEVDPPPSSSSVSSPEAQQKPTPTSAGTTDDDDLKKRVRAITDEIGARRAKRTPVKSSASGLLAKCKANALVEQGADVARLLEDGRTPAEILTELDGPLTTSKSAAARSRLKGTA